MATTMTREQEQARKWDLVEQLNPDNPRWGDKFSDPAKHAEQQVIYKRATDMLGAGPGADRQQSYEEWYQKYLDYLTSPEWQEKRAACLEYYEYKCAICYQGGHLHVHYRTYGRLFNERPSDLITLCDECHDRHHHAMLDWLFFKTNIPY